MEIRRSVGITSFFCLLLLAFGCEDPTNVGLGLVGDEEGGIPVTQVIEVSGFDVFPDDGIRDQAGQVLAGVVADPIFGTIEAEGYLDVRSNPDLPEDYANGTIERVILHLEPSYVYGDTLQPVTFALHELLSEFSISGNTQDSIPSVGPEIVQFSFLPTDDVILVSLPLPWVAEKDESLRSTDFGDTFHGFKLVHVAGNAVIGFLNNVSTATLSDGVSRLQGIIESDTVNYVADKSITRISKSTAEILPPDRKSFQNGVDAKITMNFELDDLQDVSLNRGVLELKIDNEGATPANFTRSTPTSLILRGTVLIDSDSVSVVLAEGQPADEDTYLFNFNNLFIPLPGSNLDFLREYPEYINISFHEIMQDILLGTENPFVAYDIRYPLTATSNTLDALLLHDITSPSGTPSVFITTTQR